jgi:hypothetical protein
LHLGADIIVGGIAQVHVVGGAETADRRVRAEATTRPLDRGNSRDKLAVVDEEESTVERKDLVVPSSIDPPAQVDAFVVCYEAWEGSDGTGSDCQEWRTGCDKTLSEQCADFLGNTVPQIEPSRIVAADKNVD